MKYFIKNIYNKFYEKNKIFYIVYKHNIHQQNLGKNINKNI